MADAWVTVVEREPEWDDRTVREALALDDYEKNCCPGCGLHQSVLDDPETHRFTFDERVCAVCKAQDTYGRVVAHRDEKAGKVVKDAPPSIPRPGDGRHLFLRPMTKAEREKAGEQHGGSPGKRSR